MATKSEIRLCLMILGQAMEITAQGKLWVHVDYASHVDMFEVYINKVDGSGYLEGWGSCERSIYLGDFYRRGREAEKQLTRLSVDLKALLEVDEDGVPI